MTTETPCLVLPPSAEGIGKAAVLLDRGQLVAFGTETVYGLGADATNPEAVAGIYAAKGRPSHNPLILHVSSLDMAHRFAEVSPLAEGLMTRFWPGPLTLVLSARPGTGLAPAMTAGHPTIALRFPATEVAQGLIAALGRPLAAPSANLSGRITATTAAEVMAQLGARIAAVIDSGATSLGLESTILGLTGTPKLLRHGAVPMEILEDVIGPLAEVQRGDPISAPGQLASHYAPRAAVRTEVTQPEPGELWIGFGPCPGAALSLSPSGDLAEAARTLFAILTEADRRLAGRGTIAVAPIPKTGLGRAINDRLARAMAPRETQRGTR